MDFVRIMVDPERRLYFLKNNMRITPGELFYKCSVSMKTMGEWLLENRPSTIISSGYDITNVLFCLILHLIPKTNMRIIDPEAFFNTVKDSAEEHYSEATDGSKYIDTTAGLVCEISDDILARLEDN